jgi:transposase
MGKACSTLVERMDAYRVLVGKPEGRRPLGRPRLRGRIILKGIFEKWDGCVDWIDLAQDRYRWRAVVKAAKNFRFP